MLHKCSLAAVMVTVELVLMLGSAAAFDDSKYPSWSGQWRRPSGVGTQWDQTKPAGLAQKAPLTPEYQARLEASIADQARGGQGEDARVSCIKAGMPRIMTGTRPFELVVLPAATYVYGEGNMPRRIYTDGRASRPMKNPPIWDTRSASGSTKTATANLTCSRSKPATSKDPEPTKILGCACTTTTRVSSRSGFSRQRRTPTSCIEITSVDHALTQPWTVLKTFRRERNVLWAEYDCAESNNHVVVGKEYYFLVWRRLPDAHAQGPTAAGPAVFQDSEVNGGGCANNDEATLTAASRATLVPPGLRPTALVSAFEQSRKTSFDAAIAGGAGPRQSRCGDDRVPSVLSMLCNMRWQLHWASNIHGRP